MGFVRRMIYLALFSLFIMLIFLMMAKSRCEKVVKAVQHTDDIPWIYAVTPTYWRYTQKADLTRLSQTLQHVQRFHWIVVEDSKEKTPLVTRFLLGSEIIYTHLNVLSVTLKANATKRYRRISKGFEQRNLALKWLRKNVDLQEFPGVVYFMDDDNTYHKDIFEQMRWTKKVSVWPVGFAGGSFWEGPIVENGKVANFSTNWNANRSFPIDMAAFAVNLNVLLKEKPDAEFNVRTRKGHLESTFLQTITKKADLEPLASNCTKVLVWHTKTQNVKGANGVNYKQVKEV